MIFFRSQALLAVLAALTFYVNAAPIPKMLSRSYRGIDGHSSTELARRTPSPTDLSYSVTDKDREACLTGQTCVAKREDPATDPCSALQGNDYRKCKNSLQTSKDSATKDSTKRSTKRSTKDTTSGTSSPLHTELLRRAPSPTNLKGGVTSADKQTCDHGCTTKTKSSSSSPCGTTSGGNHNKSTNRSCKDSVDT